MFKSRFFKLASHITLVFGSVFIFQQTGTSQENTKSHPKKVSLALQWHTQCQFAGYYVALEKGWYKEEGIDLTINPGATDLNPIILVDSKIAEFGTKWLADFLSAKDKGNSLISIGQIVQSNGLVMIAKAETGIKTPKDFIGKRLGIWYFGNETQFYTLMNNQGISPNKMSVEPLKWSIKPFLKNKFDVTMAMTYNEYLRVLDSGYKKKQINIIDFKDYDMSFPGHVLFTRKEFLNSSLGYKMLKASLRGWKYAVNHPEEAADIVLKYDETKKLQRERQIKQMQEITKLIQFGNIPLGYHDPKRVQFVIKTLFDNKVISKQLAPSEVYTNAIWGKVSGVKAK